MATLTDTLTFSIREGKMQNDEECTILVRLHYGGRRLACPNVLLNA
jgi:hypothetical protein